MTEIDIEIKRESDCLCQLRTVIQDWEMARINCFHPDIGRDSHDQANACLSRQSRRHDEAAAGQSSIGSAKCKAYVPYPGADALQPPSPRLRERVERDRQNDDHADHDLLDVGGDVHQDEAVQQHAD